MKNKGINESPLTLLERTICIEKAEIKYILVLISKSEN
jgi:hypothetical protein